MTWFDRSTRLAIVLSAVLAGGVALWVPIATDGSIRLTVTGVALFALGAVTGRIAPAGATRVAGAGLFVAPAVLARVLAADALVANAVWLFVPLGVVLSTGDQAAGAS